MPNPNEPNDFSDTKELRLSLVFYGGVSLAIYIHGVTKEILKLITASKAFEEKPQQNPFKESQTEHVYWNILQDLQKTKGVRTRVVADIISGTSAGGINGIFLAKALAHNQSLDGLRDMWMEKGDVKKLLKPDVKNLINGGDIDCIKLLNVWEHIEDLKAGGNSIKKQMKSANFTRKIRLAGSFFGMKMKLGWSKSKRIRYCVKLLKVVPVALKVVKRSDPPFDGNRMFLWLLEALERMDSSESSYPGAKSLMPDRHLLELFVTLTDFYGYDRYIQLHDPKQIADRRHRHVLKFCFEESESGQDQFTGLYNPVLAFASRATSCFPGAFPPINIANIGHLVSGWKRHLEVESEFFRIYQLSGANAQNTHFVDGGVLDNFPFGYSIQAIVEKPASVQVDRRLVYIEPDPGQASIPPKGKSPGLLKTVWWGLSTLPSREPILDDLIETRKFNERVRRVNGIIAENKERIQSVLRSLTDGGEFSVEADREQIREWNDKIHNQAVNSLGASYAGYTRLKLHSVTEQIAEIMSHRCNYPSESNHAIFVKEAIYAWALDRGFVPEEPLKDGKLPDEQLNFLKSFDLKYSQRRIRFVIQGINQMYAKAGISGYPARGQLDTAKEELYRLRSELSLSAVVSKMGAEISRGIKTLMDEKEILKILNDPDQSTKAFAQKHRGEISSIISSMDKLINTQLENFLEHLYGKFVEITQGWDKKAKDEVLLRYLGFPFWDALLFPIRSLSNVGELDEIEVIRISPDDVSLLEPKSARAKLKGIALGHFGAFFDRSHRENDYLWGRLDGAERLVRILDVGSERPHCKKLFETIIGEERESLREVGPLLEDLSQQIGRL